MADESYTFDTARVRLEEIAAQVKRKDVSLEKSLDLLEEGVRLANACTEQIDQAQWRTPEPETAEAAEEAGDAAAEVAGEPQAEGAREATAEDENLGEAAVEPESLVEATDLTETDEFAVVVVSEDQVVIEYEAVVVEEAAGEAAETAREGTEGEDVEGPSGE